LKRSSCCFFAFFVFAAKNRTSDVFFPVEKTAQRLNYALEKPQENGRINTIFCGFTFIVSVSVEAASINRLSGSLERNVRNIGFQQPGFGFPNQPMLQRTMPQGSDIRDSINAPRVNINRENLGVVSSQSTGNAALITRPRDINDRTPINVKLANGLTSSIKITGPLGTNTDNFDNVQMTGTDAGDFGQSFAKDGNTGLAIQLNGRPNQFGTATANNQARVNAFNVGRGNGGLGGSATSMANVNGGG